MKYQNSWVSSFLFEKNFADMLEKGLNVKDILKSNVFVWEFDLDEWPTTHLYDEECIRAYNHNMFHIRQHYRKVFPESDFDIVDFENQSEKIDTSKVYKIKYAINMLPKLGFYIQRNMDSYSKKETLEKVNEDVNLL
jgi:hypothetical protein